MSEFSTVAEFLEGLSLTPSTENRKRAYALLHAYALQTGIVFERHPQSHELLIPRNVREVLGKTWVLSAEVGVTAPRLLALWLHHRQAMLDYFTDGLPGLDAAPAALSHDARIEEMAATLRRLRPELLLPEEAGA